MENLKEAYEGFQGCKVAMAEALKETLKARAVAYTEALEAVAAFLGDPEELDWSGYIEEKTEVARGLLEAIG